MKKKLLGKPTSLLGFEPITSRIQVYYSVTTMPTRSASGCDTVQSRRNMHVKFSELRHVTSQWVSPYFVKWREGGYRSAYLLIYVLI